MNNRYMLIFIVLVALSLSGCDNRDDYFSYNNESPVLKLFVGQDEVTENFRDSIKFGYPYSVKYQVSDDKDKTLKPYLDKSSLVDFAYNYNENEREFRLDGKEEKIAIAVICVKDSYGAETKKEMQFKFFTNLPPVARFEVRVVAEREIEVNASSSYDKDQRFGGRIVIYEYDLNGYAFTSYSSIIKYKFPTAGSKIIRVKVKDSDGALSDQVSKEVNL